MITLTSSNQTRQALAHVRRAKGITQAALARTLHLERTSVSMRENGHHGLNVEALVDHAQALGFRVVLLHDSTRPTGTGWPA